MALLLCLLFLTALTLLGLSATGDTILQNQLAANLQETQRAKQSALTAQKWVENWLLGLRGPVPENCSKSCGGSFVHAPGSLPPHPEFENLSWWMDHGHEAGIDPLTGSRTTTISADSINPPMWVVEVVYEIPPPENGTPYLQGWYRVLVRGNGRTKAGVSVIESILARSWATTDSPGEPGVALPGRCPGIEAPAICGRVAWRELR